MSPAHSDQAKMHMYKSSVAVDILCPVQLDI